MSKSGSARGVAPRNLFSAGFRAAAPLGILPRRMTRGDGVPPNLPTRDLGEPVSKIGYELNTGRVRRGPTPHVRAHGRRALEAVPADQPLVDRRLGLLDLVPDVQIQVALSAVLGVDKNVACDH